MDSHSCILHDINTLIAHRLSERVWFASHTELYPKQAFLLKFSRMIYVIEGEYKTALGQNGEASDIVVSAGESIFIPAHCWDIPCWQTSCKALTILFGHYQIGMSLTFSDAHGKLQVKKATINESLQKEGFYLEKLLSDLASGDGNSTVAPCIAEGLLRYCRDRMSAQSQPSQSAAYFKWRTITLFLQKNFGSHVTRDYVAREYSITPNHLSRLFKEEGGVGFNEYLTLVRLDRVKMLLTQYSMNMTEVASRTGFQDSSYMGRVFRRHMGMTLGEYRAQFGS